MKNWNLYFDGGCLPKNPGGVATFGWVLYRPDGSKHSEDCGVVADGASGSLSTNNVAEYAGIEEGLKGALEAGVTHVQCYGDSKLVVYTAGGSWKCRKSHLIECYVRVKALLDQFESWETYWIPREKNAEADRLTEMAYQEYRKRVRAERE